MRVGFRRGAALVLALGLVAAGSGCARVAGIYTYEGSSEVAQAAAGFDASSYVDGIWQSKVLPTVTDKAVDAVTLLDAIAADPAAAGKTYGRTAGTGAAPTGPITLTVTGVTGALKSITVVTGPVIAGTALRDAVGFIDFSQFTNQIDYADVATQLNNRVKTDVVAKIDKAGLVGKTVEFAGAFSLLAPTVVSIVPTTFTVGS